MLVEFALEELIGSTVVVLAEVVVPEGVPVVPVELSIVNMLSGVGLVHPEEPLSQASVEGIFSL